MSAVGDARKRIDDTAPGSDWPLLLSPNDLQKLKAELWQEGWEHHRNHPITDPAFAQNPYEAPR